MLTLIIVTFVYVEKSCIKRRVPAHSRTVQIKHDCIFSNSLCFRVAHDKLSRRSHKFSHGMSRHVSVHLRSQVGGGCE